MGMLAAMVTHPDEVYPMVKLKLASDRIRRQIPAEPHWSFSYSMLQKVSRSFALVIQQLEPQLRDAVCVFYLVLRALDTVEDDTSIPSEIKVPILQNFYLHIYDRKWHFSCGAKDYKILMDKFHLVSTAFLELDKSYQEAIEDITRRMGAGMAKFICKEVESIDDYDEYCHYVAGLVGLGLSKLFHASGSEELASDNLSNSMGLFLQKTNIIRDYLEDINEIPKSRMFWPRQIWSKYADKLEGFKNAENSTKAVECLNDLVTNALIHAEDCLQYMSALKDLAIFRFCAIPQIMAIGTLALCYNNVEVFRGVVKMRRGLTAKIIDQTNSMSDVYGAFYEFSSLLKSKIDDNDPNAKLTRKHVEAIQKACGSSGLLDTRRLRMHESNRHTSLLIMVVFLLLALLYFPFYHTND
ncbi:squalene synthase 1 [Musa acuminata AAA Group]|uniref:squalene synthase 1 n=1 Tax=Musa acuminata AAA Group TaxID=214697 RepID=UPI0031CDBED4